MKINGKKSPTKDLFASFYEDVGEASIEAIVREQKALATIRLRALLEEERSVRFTRLVDVLLQAFMLRETNVKDICVQLAREDVIQKTWGSGNRKPNDNTIIKASG